MNKRIALVGTNHSYQGLGAQCPIEHVASFVGYCLAQRDANNLDAIAEESSPEIVASFAKNRFGGFSAIEQACIERGIPYASVDPTDAECAKLDIPSSATVALTRLEDESLAKRLDAQRFDQREDEWMRRLCALKPREILLVVGSNHIQTLSRKLNAEGADVQVLIENWEPRIGASRDFSR